MAVPDHCQKVLPRNPPRNAQLHVECPVCFALWIYENGKWTQIPQKDRSTEAVGTGL